jgi:ATP-dependent Lhr-like helicase
MRVPLAADRRDALAPRGRSARDVVRRGQRGAPAARRRDAGSPRGRGEPGEADPLAGFHEPVRTWFGATFAAPTAARAFGWPASRRGASTLILAPSGSGKTLAAFLTVLDRPVFDPAPPPGWRCRAVYVEAPRRLAVVAAPGRRS